MKKKKDPTAARLGSKGGFSTKRKYGNSHYSAIGKKGRAAQLKPDPPEEDSGPFGNGHDCERDGDCTHGE